MNEIDDDCEDKCAAGFLEQFASTPKGMRRVQSILEVATDLFSSQGYEGMTLREVARRANVTISNVQHYFRTREDLLASMLNYVMQTYDAAYERLWRETKAAGRAKFRIVVKYLLEDVRSRRTKGIFLELWSLSHRNDEVAAIKHLMYEHHVENISRLIAEFGVPEPGTSTLRTKAILVAAQIEGLMVLLGSGAEETKDVEKIQDACLEAICRLVEPPP
jgi:TetR/AcrR family transcriptional regulator